MRCDVLVLGSGPAGSAVARALASAGLDVLLADRHAFPRDKACGDALIPDALAALRRLGLCDVVLSRAHRLSALDIHAPGGRHVRLAGPSACVPRAVLDDLMREGAVAAGARFRGRHLLRSCGTVKQEKLAFLADNPFYTKRFAVYVGKRCSTSTIKDVAKELHLDRKTVKELEKHYLREKLRRAGTPKPNVIGIDELSIRKGHTYRIVVSDLERKRPVWFGGDDRKEESLNLFYQELGAAKTKKIRLAVMDMWKPFENSTSQNAPQAAILYDKFHILRHLNEALDKIRKSEYARLSGTDRRFVKGQRYTLLSHRENLTTEGQQALRTLLAANKRLNAAYVLKESFGQLWSEWILCR